MRACAGGAGTQRPHSLEISRTTLSRSYWAGRSRSIRSKKRPRLDESNRGPWPVAALEPRERQEDYFLAVLAAGLEAVSVLTAGFLAARRIREQDARCRLVVVDDTPRYAIQCLRIHAADFVLRPLQPEALRRACRRLAGLE